MTSSSALSTILKIGGSGRKNARKNNSPFIQTNNQIPTSDKFLHRIRKGKRNRETNQLPQQAHIGSGRVNFTTYPTTLSNTLKVQGVIGKCWREPLWRTLSSSWLPSIPLSRQFNGRTHLWYSQIRVLWMLLLLLIIL
jgi:hypothetical protein